MKWLRVIHILAASIWFGCAIAILTIFNGCLSPFNAEAFAIAAPLVQSIFQSTIAPASIIILIEALIYGFASHWGFFKHTWVTLKWVFCVMLVLCIAFGFFGQFFALQAKVNAPGYLVSPGDGSMLLLFSALHVVLVAIMIIISVIRPWSKAIRNA